jgi:dolichol-phosphate mannosyltransferase
MPVQATVIVVLPAYNEGPSLNPLLDSVHLSMSDASLSYKVVLVDDGSSDETRAVLEECAHRIPLTVIRHEKNMGLSATIRDGLIEAARQARDADIIVTMDADETHTPGLILMMTEKIRLGCDVVVASRYQPGARICGVPVYRRILSFGVSSISRLLFPTEGLRDFTCGYRAYRAGVLQKAMLVYQDRLFETVGFGCMLDLLLKLRVLHAVFGEVPIHLRYDRKSGKSKMRVWSTIFGTFSLLFRRRLGF